MRSQAAGLPIGGKIIQVNDVVVSSKAEIVTQLKAASAGPIAFTCQVPVAVNTTQASPSPSPTTTPRQAHAERKAVQRLSASAASVNASSTGTPARPKVKAQSVRRKKTSAVSTTSSMACRGVTGGAAEVRGGKYACPAAHTLESSCMMLAGVDSASALTG